jgi:2-desacetyl-2-hydroxyethyl bacteriochlorophyllide A dehydrogenase
MKAIALEMPGRLAAVDLPEAGRPGPGEALVAIRRIGVCGTDLHAFQGVQPFFDYPRILGHELGVEVLEVGRDVDGLRPGDHAAVEPYLNCGSCVACRRGKTNCCVSLKTLGVHTDGGMRERIILPARKLHRSTTLSLAQLALIETLGIGAHAVQRAAIEAGEWVLVRGAGPIGLAIIQFALEAGARLIVRDLNPDRLAFCRRHLGVEHLLDGADHRETLQALTDGELPTAVFEATGNAASMADAPLDVSHGGRLVFVGLIQGEIPISDPHLHRRELTLLASRNSTSDDFRRIMALVESGRIDTRPWMTHRAPFDAVPEDFPSWLVAENRVIKAIIHLD